MVARARLEAKTAIADRWPYHKAKWTVMSARVLMRGDRRMEAESYLAEGYGVRLAITSKHKGWTSLDSHADTIHPHRTKATIVSSEHGSPFLAAMQAFDIRPVARKWLATSKIAHARTLFVEPGQILVSRSGSVGKALIASKAHAGKLISDDLIRVIPKNPSHWGWIFAYLKAPYTRAMMTSARYGHIIKHLETSHLDVLPVLEIGNKQLAEFQIAAQRCLDLRNESYELTIQAEKHFEQCLHWRGDADNGIQTFIVKASEAFLTGRRRMDAWNHSKTVRDVLDRLAQYGKGFTTLEKEGFRAWLPGRFKRVPAINGVPFIDSGDILKTNPDIIKRIVDGSFGDPNKGRVESDWLLVARSGQIYGINGSVMLSSPALKGVVVSDHVIRIAPNVKSNLRPGYLCTAWSHLSLGRPLVKSLAYGSSIPEIEPEDLKFLPIVRLSALDEGEIADMAERAAKMRGEADIIERELTDKAQAIIEEFIHK